MKYMMLTVLMALSFAYGIGAHFVLRQRLARARRVLLTIIFSCLAIRSSSLAVSLLAPDLPTALIWRRLSALGSSTVYSFLLHLLLLMSGRHTLLKKRRTYLMLYLPALVNVVFYVIYTPVANHQFNLTLMDGMWVSRWRDSFLNWFYTGYYTLFLSASILVLRRWQRSAMQRAEAMLARLLAIFLTLALLLSLVLNSVWQHFGLGIMLAQTMVLFALLPALTSIQQHARLQADHDRPDVQAGHILSSKARRQTYHIAGLALFVLSYMSFFTGSMSIPIFVLSTSALGNIIMGMLLMTAAQLVYSLDRLHLSVKHQENLLLLVFVVVDLFLFVRFASIGAVTSWSSIVLIIMIGVVFNNVMMVMAAGGVHILFMLVSAYLYPEIETSINMEDHVWRILIVGAAMALAYVVNRAYKKGLQENDNYARMQENISSLALLLSEGSLTEYAQRITQAFDIARQYLQPDLLLVLKEPDSKITSLALQIRPLPSLGNLGDAAIIASLGWLMEPGFESGIDNQICLKVTDFPQEQAASRQMLQEAGVESLLLAKLNTPDKARSLVLLTVQGRRSTEQKLRNQDFVNTFSSMLTGFVRRACAETELLYLAYHDNLTGLLKRERFLQLADKELADCQQQEGTCGLVFLDLNGFKQVNDQAGHELGDQVLRQVASRLLKHSHASDLLGRFGGDEFLVLLRRQTEEELAQGPWRCSRRCASACSRRIKNSKSVPPWGLPSCARGYLHWRTCSTKRTLPCTRIRQET